MSKQRVQWSSKSGFIFATIGSAIGLGNIWRFPTAAGQSGGGVFVVIYLIIIFIIGIPLMIGELSIGRKGKRNIVSCFKQIKPNGSWWFIGALGVFTGFVILSFYSVISGWSLAYLYHFLLGSFMGASGQEIEAIFNNLVGHPFIPLFWHGLFVILTISIVLSGIEKGIEKFSKILMPILLVLLVLLAIRSVTLDGALEGVWWLLRPDFEMLSLGLVLGALGQVFFSLSLGMGALITYGSYLSDKENIPQSAMIISFSDLAIAIVAGLIIIPAVFSFGLEPTMGPPLIFLTLPLVFGALPLGSFFGGLFFLLLSIAAITSAISLLEVTVAYFIEAKLWRRKKASFIAGCIVFVLGIPSSLSRGLLSEQLILGMPFLDFMDSLSSKLLLPLAGLLTALFIGWVWTPKESLHEIKKEGSIFTLEKPWALAVKFLLPVALLYILITGLL